MVNKQPEALRLAEIFEDHYFYSDTNEAAAELRSLHDENKLLKATQYGSGRLQELRNVRDKLYAENEDFRATCDHLTRENAAQIGEIVALKEQRDELLGALREMVECDAEAIAEADALGVPFPDEMLTSYRRAVAAIAKAGGAA